MHVLHRLAQILIADVLTNIDRRTIMDDKAFQRLDSLKAKIRNNLHELTKIARCQIASDSGMLVNGTFAYVWKTKCHPTNTQQAQTEQKKEK